MSFKLKIENFGKLSEADIHIGQFTVFAGPNNSGKSFVSKLLYSLFNAMNTNHAWAEFKHLATPVLSNVHNIERYLKDKESMENLIEEMEDIIRQVSTDYPKEIKRIEIEEMSSELSDGAIKLRERYKSLKQRALEKIAKEEPSFSSFLQRRIEDFEQSLNRFCEFFEQVDAYKFPDELIKKGIKSEIVLNLTQNFQVRYLEYLRKDLEKTSRVSIDGIGNFEFHDTNQVSFDIEGLGINQLQEYSRVIYLESPTYWKLRSALENLKISSPLRDRGKKLTGVPGYFYDLVTELRVDYPGDISFRDLYEKLISEEVMGGKLIVSEAGELKFQEGERNFSLPLVAMGVINLGILALLIERKIIDKGVFLFIDEPEAHLHPAWQVKIAKTLFELSDQGVNVVIATHSSDILKFLERETEKNPKKKELIALNHFSVDGVKCYEKDFDQGISHIKEDLNEPFFNLYLEGL